MRISKPFLLFVVLRIVSILGILLPAVASQANPVEEAQRIAALANFHGGLIVHVGCGDGRLTAALHLTDNCTVQGLEVHAEQIEAARAHIRAAGLYGPVSVLLWKGKKLPYIDNLATLVVCADPAVVSLAEIMRVVRPFGAAVIQREGKWTITVKPQMPGTDQWQQHYHNADNNAVARDSVVGPPRRYQWLGVPEWQRSHMAMPSINSLVSSNGRLFTVEDLGSAEHPALPGEQALVARDAYNGVILWKSMFSDWFPILIPDKETPVQLQRRLAAVGDIVYCTPGYTAPITVFDAATGAVLKTYPETARTVEFVYDQGVLYAVTGDQDEVLDSVSTSTTPTNTYLESSVFPRGVYGPIIKKSAHPQDEVLAIDTQSGRLLWKLSPTDMQDYAGATLGVIGNQIVYATTKELVCRDRTTGKLLWKVPAAITLDGKDGAAIMHGQAAMLVLSAQCVYLGDAKQLRAFRLADGKALWSQPIGLSHHKAPDMFLANGLMWAASYDENVGHPAPGKGLTQMGVNGYDPETGKLVKHLPQTVDGPMGHDRCYRNRITDQFFINSATGGSDFLGLNKTCEFPHPWIRSTCGIGPLPCNGLYYVGPPSCSCSNGVMLNAMNALSAEPGLSKTDQPIPVAFVAALEKGPAFAATAAKAADTHDWPAYRHDKARSGTTKCKVSAELTKRWEAKIGTHVSAPTIAAGMVFVADVEGHSVCAVHVASGQFIWRFSADGRVDSPPTYYQGLLLFGSRDGTAYCLRATDGQLVWRFHPLENRLICAYGQPESAWPICGSILIHHGLAYFSAGRNSYIDGGIFLFALDPHSGKVVHQSHVYGPFAADGSFLQHRGIVDARGRKVLSQITYGIEGFKSDIFAADEKTLYLRHEAFTPELTAAKEQDQQLHLIPSHGFLEAIPHHRSFWTIDTDLYYDMPTGLGGIQGDILVIDGAKFYEVRGYAPGRERPFDPRVNGYTIYAGIVTDIAHKEMIRNAVTKQPRGKKRNKAKPQKSGMVAPSEKLWTSSIPLTGKAMALADGVLFVAGTPVAFPEKDLAQAYEGRMGGVLWATSATDGKKLAQYTLDAPPAWDGLAAAQGLLFVSLADGRIVCLGPKN